MAAATIVLLVILLAYATVTDLRQRRIPNRVTLPMLVGGLALRIVAGGQSSIVVGLVGAGLALAIMLGPFVLNWIGAGDVKMSLAIGALMGPDFVFAALLFASLAAGVIAVADLVYRRQAASTARYLFFTLHLPVRPGTALKGKLPFAPALAFGCLVAISYQVSAISQ
ncbi:MAG: prepilin peptidase [Chloroflexi bacterium]|nr:prepilin peptidase [Chloroflexota bacterium]